MDIQYTLIADALRRDIVTGRFKPGALLPPVDALMHRFGAGEYSVRHAISALAKEGALKVTPHVGARVTGSHLAKRKGRVVFVTVGRKNSFHSATFCERIGERIRNAGYEFTDVVIEAVEEPDRDLSPLEREISYGIDLALVDCLSPRVFAMLEERMVPYAATRGGELSPAKHAIATFQSEGATYTSQILAHIKRKKIANVLEIDFRRAYDHSLTKAFQAAGIAVRRLWGDSDKWKLCGAREVERLGLELVSRYFADPRHRESPPGLIVFMDDYLARGGLLALAAAGLRAPEDVKVLSQTNKNCEPVYFRRLTRFETDPERNANVVAKWAIGWLSGKKPKPPMFRSPTFIVGETL